MNALFALDNGWTGQNVLVGVLDDGVLATGDLIGQVNVALSRDFGFKTANTGEARVDRVGDDRIGDRDSDHGTSVAAIIAGRNDGIGTQRPFRKGLSG